VNETYIININAFCFLHFIPFMGMCGIISRQIQLGSTCQAPIHSLDVLANLAFGEEAIHATLQPLAVPWYWTVDICESLADLV
jgi:hypothetical protein